MRAKFAARCAYIQVINKDRTLIPQARVAAAAAGDRAAAVEAAAAAAALAAAVAPSAAHARAKWHPPGGYPSQQVRLEIANYDKHFLSTRLLQTGDRESKISVFHTDTTLFDIDFRQALPGATAAAHAWAGWHPPGVYPSQQVRLELTLPPL